MGGEPGELSEPGSTAVPIEAAEQPVPDQYIVTLRDTGADSPAATADELDRRPRWLRLAGLRPRPPGVRGDDDRARGGSARVGPGGRRHPAGFDRRTRGHRDAHPVVGPRPCRPADRAARQPLLVRGDRPGRPRVRRRHRDPRDARGLRWTRIDRRRQGRRRPQRGRLQRARHARRRDHRWHEVRSRQGSVARRGPGAPVFRLRVLVQRHRRHRLDHCQRGTPGRREREPHHHPQPGSRQRRQELDRRRDHLLHRRGQRQRRRRLPRVSFSGHPGPRRRRQRHQRRAGTVLERRPLPRPVRTRSRHRLGLGDERQRHSGDERHVDGFTACRRGRRPVRVALPDGDAGAGRGHHHRERDPERHPGRGQRQPEPGAVQRLRHRCGERGVDRDDLGPGCAVHASAHRERGQLLGAPVVGHSGRRRIAGDLVPPLPRHDPFHPGLRADRNRRRRHDLRPRRRGQRDDLLLPSGCGERVRRNPFERAIGDTQRPPDVRQRCCAHDHGGRAQRTDRRDHRCDRSGRVRSWSGQRGVPLPRRGRASGRLGAPRWQRVLRPQCRLDTQRTRRHRPWRERGPRLAPSERRRLVSVAVRRWVPVVTAGGERRQRGRDRVRARR